MNLLFISCCCLLVGRLVQYKLKYNKIFSWADCKKLEKNSSILLCWWHDCVCLWFVKSLLFCSALPGRDTICQLCERLYSLSLCPHPALLTSSQPGLGPFILDPTMGSAGLSIDQTKQEWQFRMLISVTAAVTALTIPIWPALQKTVKSTQRGYLSASRLFLPPCPNLTCWGERSIVQYWRCKLFCTLSTLYILGFVFTYEQWRDLLLDI